MANHSDIARKLSDLKKVLAGKSQLLIVVQDNPDPDGLASAMALRKLAHEIADMRCSLASNGTIGRSENRAMAKYAQVSLRKFDEIDLSRFDVVAMVDTQPGQKNNSLPDDVKPNVVIDHHPIRPQTRSAEFTDVRSRVGATATIMYQYLQAADIVPEPALATALMYGIRSDTQDFGRESCQADLDASADLYALANKRMLGSIQRGQVSQDYFRMLSVALDSARRCGNCIYSELGPVENPDMIAEVADLFLRHEDAQWSLCWGYCRGKAWISVRTVPGDLHAESVIRSIVRHKGNGGGHQTMAAGQIPLDDGQAKSSALDKLIRKRYLRATGNDPAACRRVV